MLGKLAGWEDTIVAVATPPGVGAIGVIRVSGSKAFEIVGKLFPSKDLGVQASHTMHVGLLKEGEETLDEVVVGLFRVGRSFTGEDVIEISCHGSPYILGRVVQALAKGGARLAKAGEFTQRAFLNGRLDLAQAEAVADVIASNTAASARTALHTMRGGFSRELRELRERLISFSALIELELDFSQEDVEFADRTALYRLIAEAETMTAALLASFRLGNVIRNGVSVAIVGKPNAGKSTLLNALLNENRAIVSEIAGTTRDTIEEMLNIDGVLFRLIDTAGIREHTSDVIEQIGVGRSLEKMEQADIVVYLFDVSTEDAGAVGGMREELVRKGKNFLLVGNKMDAVDAGGHTTGGQGYSGGQGEGGQSFSEGRDAGGRGSAGDGGGTRAAGALDAGKDLSGETAAGGGLRGQVSGVRAVVRFPEEVLISAREVRHIDVLKQRLVDLVLRGAAAGEGTIVTNARHYHALQLIASSLGVIRQGLDELLPGDLLALDIRHCLHYLGEITGEITTEDRLDYIFSKFCIGK
ncbi:tRNA uridine-5-carboxymethylaminomethyl(34) synthesis GTPase MnmE [Puia sp.]|uniref:tRNA uridine-5-carboxymethylaminomethyl(34) synthesis GTPase MnmE n=1 Tax=Puia sp. TaxID=2045100 RepID=UPI002F4264B4